MEKARINVKLLSTLASVLHMPAAEVREAAGIARSTWYDIMAKPDAITIQYLLAIANGLHIPVRRFFSTGRSDIVGRREDYVAEPYQECRYEGERLQEIVNSRQDATWKRAAEITDMTYQHIQKSLVAETRTPVARLLDVCHEFSIDPFTILVDPNREPEKQQKRKGSADLRQEIGQMRKEIRDLSARVDELTQKYESLLKAHSALARRVSVNFENVSSSHISIAADELMQPETDK